MAGRAPRTGSTSTTTASTTTRRRPRSWTPGGAPRARGLRRDVGSRDRESRHPDRRREPPEPHRLFVPGRHLRARAKGLRQVLGLAVTGSFSRTYCGGGVLAACRNALWTSLGQAAADLEAEFSSPNVADWKRQVADEDIRHTAAGVTSVPAIAWQNRPTFQQVVQIPVGLCDPGPTNGCRGSRASTLQLLDRTPDTRDRLAWKWTRGNATAIEELGDPRATTAYDLCVYDAGGLVARSSAPAGGTSRGRPCWRASGTRFTFSHPDPATRLLQKLVLRAGPDGAARVIAKGRGGAIGLPRLPLSALPLRVQLVNAARQCWEASYATTLANDGTRLKAKSD